MNKIIFAILCNYAQSVATTFCLLLFPSISSYKCHFLATHWTKTHKKEKYLDFNHLECTTLIATPSVWNYTIYLFFSCFLTNYDEYDMRKIYFRDREKLKKYSLENSSKEVKCLDLWDSYVYKMWWN